jgi:hypothetical protein
MEYPVIWGVYRHYKSTWWSHHTYKVIGIAKHSETDEELVIYEPEFDAETTRLWTAQFAARPVSMRFEEVAYEWKLVARFTKCTL